MKTIILFLCLLITISAHAQDNKKIIGDNDKKTQNKDKIEVLDSFRDSNYLLQKYTKAAGYEMIIFKDMKMKVNGKDYNCRGGRGGYIECLEIK